jgi:hypothetical protein
VETKLVHLSPPRDANIILGQSPFIKIVEDLHEAIVNTVPNASFGIAFCESSGPCLVRSSGNDEELRRLAQELSMQVGAGYSFLIILRNAHPINVLSRIRDVPEVVNIYAATANPLQVVVAESEQGRGILGVIDGSAPKGIEKEKDVSERKQFLRKIGYKL